MGEERLCGLAMAHHVHMDMNVSREKTI